MHQDRFWELLARQLAGETSPSETTELEQLIRTNPEWGYAASQLFDLWQLKPSPPTPRISEGAYQRHLERMAWKGVSIPGGTMPFIPHARPGRKNRSRLWMLILLLICAAAGLAWWLLHQSVDAPDRQQPAQPATTLQETAAAER